MAIHSTFIEELSSTEHLFNAWRFLNRSNPESFGVSRENIRDFELNLETNVKTISVQIQESKFKFSPTRPYLIQKENGKFRPLQIPEVRDRLVLKGIALILERELSPLLNTSKGVSFAYQKKLGIQDALIKVKQHYDQGNHFIYEADIIDFFGTVKRANLLQKIFKKLKDSSLNDLITAGISQKIGPLNNIPENQRFNFIDKGGIPQGNALSPLFSNIYLAPFDQKMMESNFKLVRYADDFVILTATKDSAKSAYVESKSFLSNELGLDLHEISDNASSKTRIIDPSKDEFAFLSVSFDGKKLFPSLKNKTRFLEKIAMLCSSTEDKNVLRQINKVKNSHDGWISNYIFTDVSRYFDEVDHLINAGIYKYLKICGWKFQKTSLGKIPKKYRSRKNKLFESGECLSNEQRKSSGIPLSVEVFKLRTVGSPYFSASGC